MRKELILLEEAKKSKVLLNGIVSIVIFLLMIFIGQVIGGILTVIVGIWKYGLEYVMEHPMELSTGPMGLILTFLFPLLLCFLWVKVVEKRKISSLGLNKEGFFNKFIKGFGIGLLMFGLVTLLMYLMGVITLDQGLKIGIKSLSGILIILPGWIIQSSTEEILSRGWLMHIVGAKHNPIIGFIVSSVAFGFLHILNPGVTILSIVNIILVGFMFGLYVIYTQDVWGACGIHAAWNFSQANIFGFNVSGLETASHSLLKFSSNGSSLLTGGQFGPEASVFSTVIMLLAILILVYKIRNKELEEIQINA